MQQQPRKGKKESRSCGFGFSLFKRSSRHPSSTPKKDSSQTVSFSQKPNHIFLKTLKAATSSIASFFEETKPNEIEEERQANHKKTMRSMRMFHECLQQEADCNTHYIESLNAHIKRLDIAFEKTHHALHSVITHSVKHTRQQRLPELDRIDADIREKMAVMTDLKAAIQEKIDKSSPDEMYEDRLFHVLDANNRLFEESCANLNNAREKKLNFYDTLTRKMEEQEGNTRTPKY